MPLLQPARYKAAYGGRGSGKSHQFAEYIIESHAVNPNESTVCIREIQKTLDQSVKRLLEQKIDKLNAGYYFEVYDTRIDSKFGKGTIIFQGMQSHNAESIKSLESYCRAWVEEAQTFSQRSLDLLRPTIRVPSSELLFSWNPRHKTDPVDKLFRRSPPPASVVVQVNYRDNPWFPDVLRHEMEYDFAQDPDKAEHIWNGAYGATQGAILARWVNKAEREGRITRVEYDPHSPPIEISSDIGFRDTASWWYWQRLSGGFSLLQYEGDSGLDADDWIPRIQRSINDMGASLGCIWLPHDARVKTFQSKHSVVEKFLSAFGKDRVGVVPQSKKQDQISAARKVIDKCAFNIDACDDGLDGLRAWEFEWIDDNNVFSKDPLHNWASHPADAFAYGCQVMQEHIIEKEKKEKAKAVFVGNNPYFEQVSLNDMWPQPHRERL